MTRKSKVFGLALVVAVALSATTVSLTQAEKAGLKLTNVNASGYPLKLSAEQNAAHVFTFEGGRKIECAEAEFNGEILEATDRIGLSPIYRACKAPPFGLPATVVVSPDCGYLLTPVKTSVDLDCTTEDIEVFVYQAGKAHEAVNEVCKYTIQKKENTKTVSYENLGGLKGIKVTANVTEIEYTRVNGSAVTCGAATGKATYTGTSILIGRKAGVLQEIHVK
jgi:hypothetical protein